MCAQDLAWITKLSDGGLSITVNLKVYSLEALFRTAYLFTDRCYLFLKVEADPSTVEVHFHPIEASIDLLKLSGEFCNELINQRLQAMIASETHTIRELIVAQAFAEADVLDGSASEAGYRDDPKGISR